MGSRRAAGERHGTHRDAHRFSGTHDTPVEHGTQRDTADFTSNVAHGVCQHPHKEGEQSLSQS